MSAIIFAKSLAKRVLPARVVYAWQMHATAKEEPLMSHVLARFNGGTAIDIGANTGVYSYHFAKRADHTVAFEPIATLAERLSTLNPKIDVHAYALSDESGTLTLHIPYRRGMPVFTLASLDKEANQGFECCPEIVPVRTLDSFELTNVSIIKIDVEGHERRVISGAQATIKRWRPILIIEIEERHHPGQAWDIVHWVETFGYDGFYCANDILRPVATFDFTTMQHPANIKTPFNEPKGEYVNNFLFLPRNAARER